jgi:hypothetical protein
MHRSLGEDPIPRILRREESAWVDRFEAVPELAKYVLRKRVPSVRGEEDNVTIWANLRPLSLNYWLPRRSELIATARRA